MDADWKFKKRCEDAADEVWKDAIEKIKNEDSIKYITDQLGEAADGCVPIYTQERWELVEYLDEHWDEAKISNTLDDALAYAIYMKASDYVSEKFQELGGEDRLDELESVFSEFNFAMKHFTGEEQHTKIVEMLMVNIKEMDELGIDTRMPEEKLKPALKPH